MKLDTVRNLAATILLSTHIGAMLFVFFGKAGVLEMAERVEIVLLLSPLTGFFALMAVKHVISEQGRLPSDITVSNTFVLFALGIPSVFGGLIIYSVASYPSGFDGNVEQLRITLSAIEVIIGGLIGVIADELFQKERSRQNPSNVNN